MRQDGRQLDKDGNQKNKEELIPVGTDGRRVVYAPQNSRPGVWAFIHQPTQPSVESFSGGSQACCAGGSGGWRKASGSGVFEGI